MPILLTYYFLFLKSSIKLVFMKKLTSNIILLLLFSFVGTSLMAQNAALDAAVSYINSNQEELGLTAADVQDYVVTDQYQNKKNKANFIYLRQRYQSIEVYNAILNLTLTKDNKVIFVGNQYVNDLQSKVNSSAPSITAIEAVKQAANALNIILNEEPQVLETTNTREFVLSKSGISKEKIPVKLMYQPMEDGTVKLVWDLSIYTLDAQNWWSVRIDATSGDLLNQANWITHCQHGSYINQDRLARKTTAQHKNHNCNENQIKQVDKTQMVGTYNVFAMPLESPIHGNRTNVVDPDDAVASPFGWHDTNGATGPEFTITRGNNVHAYQDTADNNNSIGDEPDGGQNLLFDFQLDLNQEPSTNRDAAVTNLFYWNNIIHDVWYQYGFDEASGNFQQNNYGNGGNGNDYVFAEAQDGSGTNNANFATPPDGSSGRMQMFLWDNNGGNVLTVNNGVAFGGYEASPANFGGVIDTIGVTGELVLVDDGTINSTEGCNALVNDLTGKIAVIDRGSCEFGVKCLNAQNAGAIAVIVCNNQPGLVNMAAGAVGNQVTIPAIFIDQTDGQTIRATLQNGPINATIKNPNSTGPGFLDADFDNGVITHEYGHGISTRLAGGPNNSGCLGNLEQQGEGWSDWFALVMTVEPGDMGIDKRGMGVYSAGQEISGRGIRSTAYSTDMIINGKTMSSVVLESIPHGLGSIWASMIWDMYWELVEEYGFDQDIYNGTGGNNMAMQLVIDGLKMQSCSPTFVDSRDAILAADLLNNNGANECLIWEVFARRGLGASASSGSNTQAYDFVEAFDVPLSCNNNISIVKTAPRTANAGNVMSYTLDLINYSPDTLTNVVLTDTLASNLTYVSGSASCPATSNGQVLTFNIGTMLPSANTTCTFDVSVAFSPSSSFTYIDSVENVTSTNDWINLAAVGNDSWARVQTNAYSGDWSWYITNPDVQSDISLASVNTYLISGTRPALRFFHSFDIEPGTDAGMVEISTDFVNWADVGNYAVSGAYRGPVNSGGLTIAPGRNGFYGNSNGFQETVIDLTDFIGQDLFFRFRMASDDVVTNNTGWYIDDISLIDLVMTPNTAYTTNDQNNNSFGEVAEGGTIIMPFVSSTKNQAPELNVDIFPNPTTDVFNIRFGDEQTGKLQIRVLGTDGRVYLEQQVQNVPTGQTLQVNIEDLAAGVYFIELKMDEGTTTKKLIVQE